MKEVLNENIETRLENSVYDNLKEKIYKYSPIMMIGYFVVYMIWFSILEKGIYPKIIITTSLDSYIPFNEWFIIPYILWFGYVAGAMAYFCFKSRRDFIRTGFFLCFGMTICLIIYTIFPNGINIRPKSFDKNNILIGMVKFIYSVDPANNVCPSIHCLNSIGIHLGIINCKKLKENKAICNLSLILMISICMSTVFIKQHSIIDVMVAIILSMVLYHISYKMDWNQLLCKVIEEKK